MQNHAQSFSGKFLTRLALLSRRLFTGIFRDITEHKQAGEALRKTHDELEDKARERTSELATANQQLQKEVAERKLAEAAMSASEQRYRLLFEGNPLPLWVYDIATLSFLAVNDATIKSYGYSTEEFLTMSLSDIHLPGDVPALRRMVDEAGRQSDNTGKWKHRKKDGSVIDVQIISHTLDFVGRPARIVLAIDITERERAEQELNESRQWLSAIFESSRDGIIVEENERIVYVNQSYAHLFGYEPDQLIGQPVWQVSEQEPTERMLEYSRKRILGEEAPTLYPFRGTRKDGTTVDLEASVSTTKIGEKLYIIALCRDITERKRMEDERMVISEIIQGVIASSDLNELLALIHRSISRCLYAENCFVALHDEVTALINFEFWVDKFDPCPAPRPIGVGFSSYVLRTGRPLLVDRTVMGKMVRSGDVEQRGTKSACWLGVPLGTQERTIGVLVVQHYEDETAYTKHDLEFLASVAGQIALAIERKRTEEELGKQQGFLRQVIDLNPSFIFAKDRGGRFTLVNQALAEAYGTTVDGLLGRSDGDFNPNKEEVEWFGRDDLEVIDTGLEKFIPEEIIIDASGKTRWLQTIKRRIACGNGAPKQLLGVATEITERKQAEAELRFQKSLSESQTEASIDGILVVSEDQKILSFNKRFVEIWEIPEDILASRSDEAALNHVLQQLIDPQEFHSRVKYLYEHKEERSSDEIRLKDGRTLDRYSAPIKSDQGDYFGRVWFFHDTTEHKRAEEALRESEERYRDLVQNAHDIIYSHDMQGNFTSVNRAGEEITGYTHEETLALNIVDTVSPEYLDRLHEMFARKLAGERGTAYEIEILAKDGRRIAVEINTKLMYENGVPIGVHGIARDITARKQMEKALHESEEQLRQAQKMESIGTLAGGIAHDFNNLMTAVTGYSELTLRRMPEDDPLRTMIAEIKNAGDRAASLTRQLLAFSRKQILQPVVLDLNTVVSGMGKMLPRLIGEDIELCLKLSVPLDQVKADPGQMEQVLLNLAVNARDAMPTGGFLTIKTENADLTDRFTKRRLGVEPGSYVVLSVSDDGCGMDDETQTHIFEPFFTTKEVGRGTGLGLSTVYGIVKQSGGSILVYSEVGRGTTFKIYLPRVPEAMEIETVCDEPRSVPRGHETILLVEDEDMVRNLCKEVLEAYGYTVVPAANGEDALRVCEESDGPTDLLITDVVMPQMSGRELAQRVAALRPDTKVLYMSGFTDDAVVRHGVLDDGICFIQKPFSPDALALKARSILDQNGSH